MLPANHLKIGEKTYVFASAELAENYRKLFDPKYKIRKLKLNKLGF